MDKETREAEIMMLKAQIGSMETVLTNKRKVEARIAEDRTRIEKQIKTMTGLKKTLSMQMNSN